MALTTTLHDTTINVGDTVSIHYRIIEKEVISGKTKKEKHEEQRERTQAFTGTVLGIRGSGDNQSFTVRHLGVGNIGVERIFPVISPWIKKVTLKKRGKVRRAKLYYLRKKSRKEISRLGGREIEKPETVKSSGPTTPSVKLPPGSIVNKPHAEKPA